MSILEISTVLEMSPYQEANNAQNWLFLALEMGVHGFISFQALRLPAPSFFIAAASHVVVICYALRPSCI